MMMGYYDRQGYGGLSYSNLVPSGVAETTTFPIANNWNYRVNNIIASWGYVTDFYRYSKSGAADYYTSGGGAYLVSGDDQTPTHTFNCLADFMGTSQDSAGNVNGSTTFYYDTTGARLFANELYLAGLSDPQYWHDGMLGMDKYFASAGYGTGNLSTDMTFYTQLIQGKGTDSNLGFTFAEYQALINLGLVAMIQVEGHSMFGYGYTDAGEIIFRDTWDGEAHTMFWGGSYGGMAQWGITVFTPTGGSPVPLPSSLLLMISGLAGLVGFRLRQQG
jgi:hypothetical protein